MIFRISFTPAFMFTCLLILCAERNGISQYSLNVESAQVGTGTKSSRVLEYSISGNQFSKYGGCLDKRVEETGFFNTTKVGNVWYIVDPDGYLFISSGINSVLKGGGFVLPDSLQQIGCNTMGCWSDETINTGIPNKIAYCPRWNMMLNYKNTAQRTKDLYAAGIIPVFDIGFATYCDQLASASIAPLKNDQYLLGHFSDNELPIYDNTTYGKLLDRFLAITDKGDPNFIATDNWMKARSGGGYSITDADRLEFHGYVMGTYYSIVRTAIKKYDPNHLYIGSRLHGGAKSVAPIFREAGKYVDIISINVYGVWTPSSTDMDMWVNESGKPFLVTEFYAKAEDTGLANTDGAGWLVKTQHDRALFFENFTLGLLAHRGSVGFHHFKYMDNPTVNTGLLNSSFTWYLPLKQSFEKISKDIYSIRDFMLLGYARSGAGTIYTGINFASKARMLEAGDFDATDLGILGFTAGTINSIRIRPGYTFTLFTGDALNGDSISVTGNLSSLVSIGFVGKVHSLRISDKPSNDIGIKYENPLDVRIYPNPCTGCLYVDIPQIPGEAYVSVSSIQGWRSEKIPVFPGTNRIEIPFPAPGTCLVKVEVNRKVLASELIIIH